MRKHHGFIPLIRPSVGKEELREVESVLKSGWLAQGPRVREFERRVARYLGAKYAVATSSCTTALSLAVESLELARGTHVIVPDFTFPATANVVVRGNLKPTLVDVRNDIYTIAKENLRTGHVGKTSAIMPVHAFGHPFEMDEIHEISEKRGITVIEDAATAFGTKYKGRKVGNKGQAVCFSFHPRKLLTTGEGGCLVTDDSEVYERARVLRSHGQVGRGGKLEFLYNGLNYRMSDVHAAIGIAQLSKIDRLIQRRREQAKLYEEIIRSTHLDVTTPAEMDWAYHTYQSYVVVLGARFPERNKCIRALRTKFNIETQVGTYSLSEQIAFRGTRAIGSLDNSRFLYSRTLTLPLYESLSEEQQGHVVGALAEIQRS